MPLFRLPVFVFLALATACSSTTVSNPSSSSSGGSGAASSSGAASASFEGTWSGTYTGAETGTLSYVVDASGNITATAVSPSLGTLHGTGTVDATGKSTVAGFQQGGLGELKGTFETDGKATGTWGTTGGATGTWSIAKP